MLSHFLEAFEDRAFSALISISIDFFKASLRVMGLPIFFSVGAFEASKAGGLLVA